MSEMEDILDDCRHALYDKREQVSKIKKGLKKIVKELRSEGSQEFNKITKIDASCASFHLVRGACLGYDRVVILLEKFIKENF